MRLRATHAMLKATMVACAIALAGLLAFAGATGLRGAVGDVATRLLFGMPLLSIVSGAAVVIAIQGGAGSEPMPPTQGNLAFIACGILVVVVGIAAVVAYAFE